MNFPSAFGQDLTTSMNDVSQTASSPGAVPTIGNYLNSIMARKWLVILLTLLAFALSYFVAQRLTPIYASQVSLQLQSGSQQVVSIEELYSGGGGGREFKQTQIEFIKSREVASRVMKELNLIGVKGFDPRRVDKSGFVSDAREWLATFPALAPYVAPSDEPAEKIMQRLTDQEINEMVLARLRDSMTVTPIRLSQLVRIAIESPDPVMAARIANTVAQSYITADLDARFEMQQGASRWLNERLAALRTNLEESETALQDFREELGLIATRGSSMGGNVVQLDSASGNLVTARANLAQAKQIYQQVRRNQSNRYQVPEVFNNPAVTGARSDMTAAEIRLNEAKRTLGQAHPNYVRAKAEYEAARRNYFSQAEAVIRSIQKQYEVAESTVAALEANLQASRGDIQTINRKEGKLVVLQREVATNQEIYQTFLARVKETDATSDFRTPVARIVDPATPALLPSKPRKAAIVLLSGLVGALLASLLAIALEQRNAAIRSTDDVETKLGLPLIATAPKVSNAQSARLGLAQIENPTSIFAESIRTAATSISLATRGVDTPVIGFTSAVPGEGKSTLAINFALELARTKKTLLIDCDLRKPTVHVKLGMGDSKLGLSELYRDAPANVCIQQFERDNLSMSVLFAGSPPQNPLDMFMNEKFGEIINHLKKSFDVIVIDTPPGEMVSDVLSIGQICDGLMMVVKASETPVPMIRRVAQRLVAADIHVFGVFLNGHDHARAGKYYGEYSAVGSGYSGYYGRTYGADGPTRGLGAPTASQAAPSEPWMTSNEGRA